MVFNAPVRDQSAWSNSTFDPGTGIATRLLQVDYTGQAAQYLLQNGVNLHTSTSGFVTETPIGTSGLMEVSVNLETRNALTTVINIANSDPNQPNSAPIEFGYRPQELVGHPELAPSLSSVHFQITWQQNVGTDLPDLARLNENYALYAPPGFSFERFDVQSWGTGTLRADTTVGTPGQIAIASTCQIADVTARGQGLPGTLGDGSWQEPVDLIPVASASIHVAALNGTLFVSDTSDGNDFVRITPAANGGATVYSNLGEGTFANVTRVVVALGNGNNDVQIDNLTGATVDVVALNGNNDIDIGRTAKLAIHVGGGNNHISTKNSSPAAQFIFVGGNGNNHIDVANSNSAEILVAGNGNNHISASGTGDFIEVLGNGNNRIKDDGSNDLIWLGGSGNNDIDNGGDGSFTDILTGSRRNRIRGPWGFAP